jgi:hypothetical protein
VVIAILLVHHLHVHHVIAPLVILVVQLALLVILVAQIVLFVKIAQSVYVMNVQSVFVMNAQSVFVQFVLLLDPVVAI